MTVRNEENAIAENGEVKTAVKTDAKERIKVDKRNGLESEIANGCEERAKRGGDFRYRLYRHPHIRRYMKMLPGYFNRIVKRGVFAFDLLPQHWRRKRYVYADGDFVRNSTLELVAREIRHNKVKGAVAELGVFRGDFARLISMAFPDRRLYLFDTFSGFDAKDISTEKAVLGRVRFLDCFADTDVDAVLARMLNPGRCIVKKGYFPDTFADVDEKFAFVSIDCDLYQPTYDGLVRFWENLNGGGVYFCA